MALPIYPPNPQVGDIFSLGAGKPSLAWNGLFWSPISSGAVKNPKIMIATAGQQVFLVDYVPGSIDVYFEGTKLVEGDDFTATNGTSVNLTFQAVAGQTLEAVPRAVISTLDAPLKTNNGSDFSDKKALRTNIQVDRFNRPKNRFGNPSMRVNQRSAGALDLSGSNGWPADRWGATLNVANGTLRASRVVSQTPGGSTHRLRVTAQAAKASFASTDLATIYTAVEGFHFSDAGWGTGAATAKNVIVRLGVRSSVPGTFGISARNGAIDLSWVGSITILPSEVNTDLVRTLIIPAKIDGSWYIDQRAGFWFTVCLGVGPTYAAPAQGWNTGNLLGLSGQTNFMATAGATFELFDVGLYVDTDNTGIVPPWELPWWDDELRACKRYFQADLLNRDGGAAGADTVRVQFEEQMRTVPTMTLAISASGNLSNATLDIASVSSFRAVAFMVNGGAGFYYSGTWTASAEF